MTRFFYVATAVAAVIAGGALTASIPTASARAATECAPSADGVTPSLAVQDACGNHVMGSEVPGSASNTGDGQPATSAPQSATAAPRTEAKALTPMVAPSTGSKVLGFDISGFQPSTDWATAVKDNYKFVYMKATEGTGYVSSYFTSQWVYAGQHNLIRGAYHFAQPTQSSGATQATYFYDHGAALSTKTPGTLPPVLDMENSNCAGMSKAAMVSWISSFMSKLTSLTGRTPVIYTYKNWWLSCTGDNTALAKAYPLWVADPTPTTATQPRMPAAWSSYTFWQWGAPPFSGGGDSDVYWSTYLATLQNYASYPRIAGSDRWSTSVNTAQSFFSARSGVTPAISPKPGNTVYLASGTSFPDALSGGGAAGLQKAPILLVSKTSVPTITARELSVLRPQNIVILGGTSAVSSAVYNAVVKYTASGSKSAVRRAAGSDRWGTSASAATAFPKGTANVYIASGTNWPDALSGGAAAASPKSAGPVLLVEPGSIPASIASALWRIRPKSITILGGTSAVSAAVGAQLRQYTASGAGPVLRLSGSDRFATSASIATHKFSPGVQVAYVASGTSFPDALSGAPLSTLTGGAPVLLTTSNSIPSSVASALRTLKPKSIVVLGGSSVVSAGVQSALKSYVVQ